MKLKFYKTGFKPEQNGVYEELATYLSTLTPKHSFTDVKSFGYFHLDETVKLPLDSHAFSFTGADLGDYCVAIDDAAEYPATYYYFVRGISWLAKSTVSVDLRLDTLNTFREQIEFTAETHVTRRLQNRWTVTDSDTLYPVISKTSEPFSVNFIETADKAITDEAVTAAEKWYIVWQTTTFDISQISGKEPYWYYILPEKPTQVRVPISTYWELTAYNIPCDNTGWFAFTDAMNDDRQFTVTFTYRPSSGGTTTMVRTFVISSNQWFVVAKSETGNLLVQVRSTDSSSGLQIGEGADALLDGTVYSSTYLTSIRFDTINTIYRQTGTYPWLSTAYDYANLLYIKPLRVNGYTYLQTLAGFDEWFKANSTSSSIVKILQLPYCPIEFEDTGTALVFEDDSYDPDDYGLVISPSVVTAMTHEIVSERPALTTLTKDEVDVTLARSQTTKDETKLLNSSYGPYTTYSYDASSWVVKPELLPGVLNYDSFKVTITQLASAQGGLAFTFKTPQLRLSADDWYIQSQRDNSIPYFTDEYINYLKYGKKADEMQYAFSAAQAVVQGVGTGISTGFTIAALSQSAGPVAGVLGAAVGASTAAISLAASMAQQGEKTAENQRKMQESGARNSTANDVSIFSSLNQQALRRRTFQPVTGITAVRDYFHFFGYATDEYYSIDLTRQAGRYWFDYLQCTPVWKSQMWQDRQDDITERFKFGVTIYHWHDKYDLEKAYVNWESDVVEWAQS